MCLKVCMHARVYVVCMYVCMHACTCICGMYVCVYACIHMEQEYALMSITVHISSLNVCYVERCHVCVFAFGNLHEVYKDSISLPAAMGAEKSPPLMMRSPVAYETM